MANSPKLIKKRFKTIKVNHRASIPFTRLQIKSIKNKFSKLPKVQKYVMSKVNKCKSEGKFKIFSKFSQFEDRNMSKMQ